MTVAVTAGNPGVSPRDREWLARLQVVARDLPKVSNQRIAAALVEGRSLLGMGVNSYKSHPLQQKYSRNPQAIYMHAEIAAIVAALRGLREYHHLGRSTMYVARVGAGGEARLARPCEGCMRALRAFEVGRVIWT